jgi:hypothetical protein
MSSSDDDVLTGSSRRRSAKVTSSGIPISLERVLQYHAEISRLLGDSTLPHKTWVKRTRRLLRALATHRDLRYNVSNYANIYPPTVNGEFGQRVVTFHMALLGPLDVSTNEYGSWRTMFHGIISDSGQKQIAGWQNNQKVTSDLEEPTGRPKHQDTVARFVGPRYTGLVNNGITIRPAVVPLSALTPAISGGNGGQAFDGVAAYGLHGNFV